MSLRSRFFALVLLALTAAPCSADLYAYIDETGRHHVSDVKLDARYELYRKTPLAESAPAKQSQDVSSVTLPAALRLAPMKGRKRYTDMIARVAREHEIEPALLHAVIAVESAYDARARSPRGATGLMQLMPATGKRYGATDLLNPLQNLRAGARYLNDLLSMFDNNLRLVIAAYNAGEGAVLRSGNAIPPYAETRAYVPRVLKYYEAYLAYYREL